MDRKNMAMILSIAVLGLSVMSIVVMALIMADKNSGLVQIGVFTPIAATVFFILELIFTINTRIPNGEPSGTASAGYYGYTTYGVSWGFFVACALLLIASVLCIKLAKEK